MGRINKVIKVRELNKEWRRRTFQHEIAKEWRKAERGKVEGMEEEGIFFKEIRGTRDVC